MLSCAVSHKDYAAAIGAGTNSLIVSCGFEGFERLTERFDVPPEGLLRTPVGFYARVLHALDLAP